MYEIDVKSQLDLLNVCLDNWMDSLIFDCFVTKPYVVVGREKPIIDVAASSSMCHPTPYDCGDPPLINCNALPLNSSSSFLNSEVLQYADGACEHTDGVSEYTDGVCTTQTYVSGVVTPPSDSTEYTGTSAGSQYNATGGLTEYNWSGVSHPRVITKKKSRAVDIIDPSTGEKVIV